MKKLIQGLVEFRRTKLASYRKEFAKLALGQSPDALYIGCSDSRVAVNVFASTNPGDLFVLRNVGNIIPPYEKYTHAHSDESEAVAIEFALNSLNVAHIIVCGHSECGAMNALISGREKTGSARLSAWLRHGDLALKRLDSEPQYSGGFARHNRLSQLNVLHQLEHIRTYPVVQERLKAGTLSLHAWWYELKQADVYAYEDARDQFVLIDETEAALILKRLGEKA